MKSLVGSRKEGVSLGKKGFNLKCQTSIIFERFCRGLYELELIRSVFQHWVDSCSSYSNAAYFIGHAYLHLFENGEDVLDFHSHVFIGI